VIVVDELRDIHMTTYATFTQYPNRVSTEAIHYSLVKG